MGKLMQIVRMPWSRKAQTTMRRLVVSIAIVGLGLSIAGPAMAKDDIPPRPSLSDCLLKNADGTYKWVASGYVAGNYVCLFGKWTTYAAGYHISVNDVTLDRKSVVEGKREERGEY